jgi:subtilisin family serine protease
MAGTAASSWRPGVRHRRGGRLFAIVVASGFSRTYDDHRTPMTALPWPPPGELRLDSLRPYDGRGVRIAIVDSGVHDAHPHVAGCAIEGVGVDAEGRVSPGFVDRLGHGTAVAAAIAEKAPGSTLLVARVFERELKATAAALVAAVDWAVAGRARLINLSLGTTNPAHADLLAAAVGRARSAGVWIVAAGPEPEVAWLPGSLPDVIGVSLDWTLPRDQCCVEVDQPGSGEDRASRISVRASGYPRPIPGVPPERNLKGLSFAVANATGLLALTLTGK